MVLAPSATASSAGTRTGSSSTAAAAAVSHDASSKPSASSTSSAAGAVGAGREKSDALIADELAHTAHNYHALPVVFERAQGAVVTDVDGKEYIDCLAGYSALNQGHCHPKIVAALTEQASKLTLSSRAFHSANLGAFARKVTSVLGFDCVLPMNTGAEAVETALKLARRWAYDTKGVSEDKALILAVSDNFHGRTLGVISMSTDPDSRAKFGPYLDNVGPVCPATGRKIRFGEIDDVRAALEAHAAQTAALLVEPIQGEAGIKIPPPGYLAECRRLCKEHNVLFICDEIQSGLGRTGHMLAYQRDGDAAKPDIVTVAKALSGGVYPVSAVLASRDVMHVIRPGEHGSTYGGNALACAVACAALDVLVDEKLCDRSAELGKHMREQLEARLANCKVVKEIRGTGLMNAIVIDDSQARAKGRGAWDVCLCAAARGVLCKPTHKDIIRLTPPLVISKDQVGRVVDALVRSLEEFDDPDFVVPLKKEDEERTAHFFGAH